MKKAVIFDLFGVLVREGETNTELVTVVRELKEKGITLFLLSNADADLGAQQTKTFPFLQELFDKFYYFGLTGFVKSDERAYKIILEENNLKPEEVAYFDDSERNIKVASSLGIASHLYQSPDQVKEILTN